MKKCPNCQKTFDDNMKFCQTDGTPLVVVADNKPEADPYATMVANKSDLQIPPETPEAPKEEVKVEPKPEADPYATMVAGSSSIPKDEPKDYDEDEGDLLEVFDNKVEEEIDLMKTMIVSGNTADNIKVNIPDEEPKDKPAPTPPIEPPVDDASEAATVLSPNIPKFNEPIIDPPNLGDSTPEPMAKDVSPKPVPPKQTPSSPFDSPKTKEDKPAPIPSPFDSSMPPGYAPPSTPPFEPPKEPLKPEPLNVEKKEAMPKSPFAEPQKPVVEANKKEWNTSANPPAQAGNAGNQSIANSDFNSPMVSDTPGGDGQNQTLAYVSLGFGIASYVCMLGPLGGIVAIITGFMARKNINENPNQYGGGTLAMIGMVLGGISVVISILVIILWVVLIAMAN